MSKATRILNEYHIKELILKGNPQYENFYKEELIEFCKISKHEIERLNNIINRIDNFVDRTIDVIKQQPTGDDEWILERLNGIKYLIELKDSD